MKDKMVLVCEVGSANVRAMIARRGLNGIFKVKGYTEIEYDGFYEGEFLNKDKQKTRNCCLNSDSVFLF